MGWYRTGTVNVAANSATITGVGTAFLDNVKIGDEFAGPDGRSYEITNIATNTSLTVMPAYKGATATGQAYHIKPTQSWAREAALQLANYTGRIGGAIQKAEGAVQVSQLLIGEDGAIAGQNGVPTQGWRGIGTLLRAWRVAETTQNPVWVKLVTVTGAANQRASIQLTGAAAGYGSNQDNTAAFGVLLLTFGNASLENNLNVRFFHTATQVSTGAGGSRAFSNIVVERHSNTSFTVWLKLLPFAYLVADYSGTISKVEPHTSQYSATDPVGFDKSDQIIPFVTMANSVGDPANGGIVLSGSNANGNWTRFADGTQIAWVNQTLAAPTDPATNLRVTRQPPVAFAGTSFVKNILFSVADMNVQKNYQYGEDRGSQHTDCLVTIACVGAQTARSGVLNVKWTGRWK